MSGSPGRILIVDDNPDDIAVYSRWLRSAVAGPIDVRTACSLQSAIDACEIETPDCILLDYDLRDSTGIEVISELERRGVRSAIIAMTGSGSETIAVDFMRSGVGDYLIKSEMSAASLRATVHAQLAKSADRDQIARAREEALAVNEQLGVELDRASFLAATGRRLPDPLNLDATLSAAVGDAIPFLADICTIDVVRAGRLRRHAVCIDSEPPTGLMYERLLRRGADVGIAPEAARVLRTAVPAYLSDRNFSDAGNGDVGLALLAEAGIKSAAIVPLRSLGLTMGLITFGTRSSAEFPASQRPVLSAYAERVAREIANAHVAATDLILQDDAVDRQHRLAFAHHVSSLLARSSDWQATLPHLIKTLTASFSDAAAIFSVDARTHIIRLIAAGSRTAELEGEVRRYYADHPPLVDDSAGSRVSAPSANRNVLEPERDPPSAWAAAWELCVPLLADDAIIGVLTLLRERTQPDFERPDIALAQSIGRQVSTFFASTTRYTHQHDIATALQAALRPFELPVVADLLFAFRYFPGSEGADVGGDWYDVVNVNPRRMVITIGDVKGLGVKAAAVMGQYRDIIRAYAFERFGPAAALARLNDIVIAQGSDQFATCAIVMLDRQTRRICYALAGHPPPLLRLPDGGVQVLDAARSMPIGAWKGTRYVEAFVDVPAGATLILYTDGLVETRRRSASDGIDLLEAAVRESRSDIELMLDDVLRALSPGRSDDVAILAIELLSAPSASRKRWAFARSDRTAIDTVRSEFDAFLGAAGAAGSDTYGARIILGELLANIVQHAPGQFRLDLDWTGDSPVLRLDDNGPGFSIPERFTQPADPLSPHGRGLFIMAQVGRNLSFTPRRSGGLTTRITLPLYRKAIDQPLTALSTM